MKLNGISFRKTMTGIFIVVLVLLIGKDVKADGNWGGFVTDISNPQPNSIYLNNYIDQASKTLTWGADGMVIGQKNFYGLNGNNFAILDGTGGSRRHGLGFFPNNWPIQDNLRIYFSGNFEFKKFDLALSLNNSGPNYPTVYFSNSAVRFTQNSTTIESRGTSGGAAIYAVNGKANFTNSTVSFIKNAATLADGYGGGGAIYAENTEINFNSSVVNFTSNTELQDQLQPIAGGGGAVYLANSKINFNSSIVNFTSNTSFVGGAIYGDNQNVHVNFSNSIVNFTSNTALYDAGAVYVQGTISGDVNFSNSIVNFISNKSNSGKGGALLINNANVSFANSTAAFIQNAAGSAQSGAIYAGWSKISFINTDVFFADNGDTSLWLSGSELIISGNFIFAPNAVGNDIYFEEASVITFVPETGKTIRFKGKFDPNSSPQNRSKINKFGYGTVVFDKETPIVLPKVDFLIAQGEARFEKLQTGNSTNTFKKVSISSAGYLSVKVDFGNLTTTYFQTSNFYIAEGASLLVYTDNVDIGTDTVGSSVDIVSTTYAGGDFGYASQSVFGGGKYTYSFRWQDGPNYRRGILTLTHVSQDSHIDPVRPPGPPHVDPSDSRLSTLDFFIVNAIRQAAIADNSLIYSNIKEEAWGAVQINGGSLADDDLGDFKNSAAGVKAGYRVFNNQDKSAGVFAGFGSRAYEQGRDKAAVTDIDFGAYGSFDVDSKVSLAGFLGFGLQSIKAEGGGSSADFSATVVKFGAKAEYDAGLLSPFLGLEGAIVKTDDVNLGGATLEAGEYTRLSNQIGAKIARQAGKLAWFGRAYIDLLLAGAKPQYSVKPDVEGARIPIDGTVENAASFGFGAGGSLPVSKALDIFANADIKLGGDYFGYQTNIGGRFKF